LPATAATKQHKRNECQRKFLARLNLNALQTLECSARGVLNVNSQHPYEEPRGIWMGHLNET